VPVLFRVHEKPRNEDLLALLQTLKEIGLPADEFAPLQKALRREKDLSHTLQRISAHYQDTPLQNFVNQHILRALTRARYLHEDLGHFGLATESYTHFTSPIRRYSDLVVHRLLKTVLNGRKPAGRELKKLTGYLKHIGEEISEREKKTDDAMFEVIRLKTAAYMQRRIGDVFSGVVTSILPFGIFVEIFDPPFDGLVSLGDMGRARIEEGRAVKLKNRVITIGDVIGVRVARVDILKGHVDFTLLKPGE
jgi:ribonuclease R